MLPVVESRSTTTIYAAGICCPMEVPLIESVLQAIPGVQSVDVTVMLKTVTIEHDATRAAPAALVAALNAVHLDASLQLAHTTPTRTRVSWTPPTTLVVALVFLVASLPALLDDALGIPAIRHLEYLALGAVAATGPTLARKAFAALRNRLMDINLLTLLAVVCAIAMGMYQEAGAVAFLLPAAEFLEDRCTAHARAALASAAGEAPSSAVLADGTTVDAHDITIGTHVLVRPGDACPVDGLVLHGVTHIDESLLTGEARGVPKSPGLTVHGGTVNTGRGTLVVACTAPAAASAAARVATTVERAAGRSADVERAVTRFAKWYTPIVVVAAVVLATVPTVFFKQPVRDWVYLALQVLVTACPCALVLATPATVVSALAAAARVGVVIKGGEVLERIAAVKVVTLDKTGTVTHGVFKVSALGGCCVVLCWVTHCVFKVGGCVLC